MEKKNATSSDHLDTFKTKHRTTFWIEVQTNPFSWNIRHTLALADVNEQKQHSETHSFSVGKRDESDYQQIT